MKFKVGDRIVCERVGVYDRGSIVGILDGESGEGCSWCLSDIREHPGYHILVKFDMMYHYPFAVCPNYCVLLNKSKTHLPEFL